MKTTCLIHLGFLQSSAWFPTKTQVKFVGDFTVKHVSEAKGSYVTITKLVLQSKVLFKNFQLINWCLAPFLYYLIHLIAMNLNESISRLDGQ